MFVNGKRVLQRKNILLVDKVLGYQKMNFDTRLSARNKKIYDKIMSIGELHLNPIQSKNSPWLRPMQMSYVRNGKVTNFNLTKSSDGICVIIFNKNREKLVLVKQFRPTFYINSLPIGTAGKIDVEKYPLDLGITLEFCGGRVDKQNKSVTEIAKEEILEECGYDVPLSSLNKIQTYRYVDSTIAKQHLFYVEVTDDMLVGEGGGLEDEGELIMIEEMSIDEARKYIRSKEVPSPTSFLNGLTWFLINKAKDIDSSKFKSLPTFFMDNIYKDSTIVPGIKQIDFIPFSDNTDQVILYRVKLLMNEKMADWDFVKSPIYINIVVFNVTKRKFVALRQFSPSAYCCSLVEPNLKEVCLNEYPASLGVVLKLCGGIFDRNKSLEDNIREKVSNKCRYDVPASAFEKIISHGQISNTATRTMFFYVKVTDDMKIDSKGDLDHEVLEMSVDEIHHYVNYPDVQSPPCFLFGIRWFLLNNKIE